MFTKIKEFLFGKPSVIEAPYKVEPPWAVTEVPVSEPVATTPILSAVKAAPAKPKAEPKPKAPAKPKAEPKPKAPAKPRTPKSTTK
jgi:hypothetical protein